MKQVFVDQDCQLHSRIYLDEQQAHHLFDVLRIQKKEVVRVVANQQVFLAHPEQRGYLYLFDKMTTEQNMQHITLCASLIKQDKFEWMLQKACELGVTRIVPFVSRNTVIRLDEKKAEKKLERWSKILLEACKQCNRNDLVEFSPIQTISSLLSFQSECNLVAYEKENDPSKHLAHYLKDNPESITLCIGPEGGFETFEIAEFEANHFQLCSLGPRILRAETAACYALAAIEYQQHVKE